MCKRVYKRYKLKITTEDETKDVKINKSIDTTNYKIMMEFYRECKKRNEENDCVIDFIGITEDGLESIMFSKEYCKEANRDKELLIPTDQIVSEIKHLLGLLERKKEYHNEMLGSYDKRQQVILHNIEHIQGVSDEEKLKVLSDLELLRKDRRFNKDEFKKLNIVDRMVNIKNVVELFDKINIPIHEKDYKFLDKEELQEKEIITEIKYINEKQRVKIIKSINGKYDKIVNDSISKTLICYNKAHK